jgi:hypothetical protein
MADLSDPEMVDLVVWTQGLVVLAQAVLAQEVLAQEVLAQEVLAQVVLAQAVLWHQDQAAIVTKQPLLCVQPDHPATKEPKANQGPKAKMQSLAVTVWMLKMNKPKYNQEDAALAPLEIWDHQVHQAKLVAVECEETEEWREEMAEMDSQDLLDKWDHLDHLEHLEIQVWQDRKDHLDKRSSVNQERKEPQDPPETQETQETAQHQAPLDQLDHRVKWDLQVYQELKVAKEMMDPTVNQEKLAKMHNTALALLVMVVVVIMVYQQDGIAGLPRAG